MNGTGSAAHHGQQRLSAWITAVLAVSAVATVGFWLVRAAGEHDTEPLESPLMLSVARQLVAGPWDLYGPYGGRNHLVLIHAPVYYHLAALAEWPFYRAGLDVVTASRVAGRSLSVVGLLMTLILAYRLARLDGAPRRAGWWAVLLIAATPVIASQSFAVRPDLVGVALQTAGVLLVLSALRSERPQKTSLLWAYAAFGVAVGVKQHFLMAAVVSTGLVLRAWWRGQVSWSAIERSILAAAAIVAAVYGIEGVATGGRMWQATIVAAAETGRIHPGGWSHVYVVLVGVIERIAGLLALLAAAGLSAVAARAGIGWRIMTLVGTGVIVLILTALVLHPILYRPETGALAVVASIGALAVLFPIRALLERSSLLRGWLDATLFVYLAAEIFLFTVLFWMSSGAWDNYVIQALVFASVLTARAVSRVVDFGSSAWVWLPPALAVIGVLVAAFNGINDAVVESHIDRTAVNMIIEHVKRPSSEFFFSDRPGLNRMYGRLDLVYDDWLYPVFESLRLAEHRSRWLLPVLTSGPVRVIVNSSDRTQIDGIDQTLPALGYRRDVRVGPFFVWTR